MANYCTNCGTKLEDTWKFCPFCSNHIYHRPEEPFQISEKKRLTKRQKIAIIIGIVVIISAIIIPIGSILTYQYLFPQKTLPFYVNNGNTLTSYTVSTTRTTLTFFENQPHPSHTYMDPNHTAQVVESYCTPYDESIIQIAQAIRSECIDQYDSEEVINALLSFTQAVGYKVDPIDLAQYPLETIFHQGDCEDLSILFGSLVVSLGFEAIIVVINYYDVGEGQWFGHACIGVYLDFTPTQHSGYPPSYSFNVNSKNYWVCETTYQGWMIGELPTASPSYYIMEAYSFID